MTAGSSTPENMFIPGLGEASGVMSNTRRARARSPQGSGGGTIIARMGGKGSGAPNEKTTRFARQAPPPADAYHPFERAGGGAPLVDHHSGEVNARTVGAVRRTSLDMTQRKADIERKRAVMAAQAQFLEEQKRHVATSSPVKDTQPPIQMENFFKWQGRSATEVAPTYRRMTSDVIANSVDSNGGIGRRQKGPHSQSLNETLKRQQQARVSALSRSPCIATVPAPGDVAITAHSLMVCRLGALFTSSAPSNSPRAVFPCPLRLPPYLGPPTPL